MYLYNPNLESFPFGVEIPRWVFFLNGSCMLIYQTLDNMDGKQARRTGSSSPLGMLFDHGCDAINSPLGSINWCVAMGIGVNQPFAVLWTLISSAIPFYFSTWEVRKCEERSEELRTQYLSEYCDCASSFGLNA